MNRLFPHLERDVARTLTLSLHDGLCVRDNNTGILALATEFEQTEEGTQKNDALCEVRLFAEHYRTALMNYTGRPSSELSDTDRQALFILDMCQNTLRYQLVWQDRMRDIPLAMELVDFDECIGLAAIHLWHMRLPPGDRLADVIPLRKAA